MASIKSGSMIGGKWMSYYDQGYDAYKSGVTYRDSAGPVWQSGWRAGRNSDLKFLTQVSSQALKSKIEDRLLCMMAA